MTLGVLGCDWVPTRCVNIIVGNQDRKKIADTCPDIRPGRKFGLLGPNCLSFPSLSFPVSPMFKLEKLRPLESNCPTFSLSELSNFSYALEENSDMLELKNMDFSNEKFQISRVSVWE